RGIAGARGHSFDRALPAEPGRALDHRAGDFGRRRMDGERLKPHGAAAPYTVGFDLGGTNLKVVALTGDGTELGCWTESSGDDPESWVRKIRGMLGTLQEQVGRPASWVGIAAP